MDQHKLQDAIYKWHQLKQELDEVEAKLESYKEIVKNYMMDNKLETVITDDLIVKKYKCERESVSKKDLPLEIWNKYSKQTHYDTYKLIPKKS